MSDADYNGTYLVIGPPGTGKTTFLSRQVKAIVEKFSTPIGRQLHPNPVLICSLTRAAAAEVAGRDLPINRKFVGTLHAHCFRALETPKIATGKALEAWNQKFPNFALGLEADDVEDPGLSLQEADKRGAGDAVYVLHHLLRHRMVPQTQWPSRIAEFSKAWEEWKNDSGLVDFTDLIVHCLEAVDEAPGSPRVVLADEAQDMSRLEYSLVKKWGAAAGAMIVVGDPRQAIYDWRGADPNLFDDPDVPPERRRVLGQSYRVPERVLRVAVRWARNLGNYATIPYAARREPDPFEPDPAKWPAAPGDVVALPATWRSPALAVTKAVEESNAGRTCMIAATCSYMLWPIIAELRERGVPFQNPWRRHRGDWNPMHVGRGTSSASRLVALFAASEIVHGPEVGFWTCAQLWAWSAVLQAKGLFRHGAKKALEAAAEDRPDAEATLPELFGWFLDEPVVELMRLTSAAPADGDPLGPAIAWYTERLNASSAKSMAFPLAVYRARGLLALTEEPRVYVGTVHSFKGSESSAVVLFPDVSPSAYRQWCQGGAMRDPVVRTFYVGITRARDRLYLCAASGTDCVGLQRLIGEEFGPEEEAA